MSVDDILLDLEARHAATIANAKRAESDRQEAAYVAADGLAVTAAGYRAETLAGLGAKARLIDRQSGGRFADMVEAGGIAERMLAASILQDAARLLAPPRVRSARVADRKPLALIAASS